MKYGQCPKCESEEVHVVSTIRNDIIIPLGVFSVGSATNLYVCVECGYIEIYVQDKTDLPKIAERWPRLVR
jgi:predicted nucleic-acid-binding Zn-ribbon protein